MTIDVLDILVSHLLAIRCDEESFFRKDAYDFKQI